LLLIAAHPDYCITATVTGAPVKFQGDDGSQPKSICRFPVLKQLKQMKQAKNARDTR